MITSEQAPSGTKHRTAQSKPDVRQRTAWCEGTLTRAVDFALLRSVPAIDEIEQTPLASEVTGAS